MEPGSATHQIHGQMNRGSKGGETIDALSVQTKNATLTWKQRRSWRSIKGFAIPNPILALEVGLYLLKRVEYSHNIC